MPQQQKQQQDQNAIVITNFGGRLTRILNGDMNSGFAKYNTSFGYDPFSKPMNLTWFEQPTEITGQSAGGLVVAAAPLTVGVNQYIYAINHIGSLLQIIPNSVFSGGPNNDFASVIGSVIAGNPTYLYGASMDFFQNTTKLYISNDNSIHSIGTDGSAEHNFGSTNMAANVLHPLQTFAGKMIFGNGNTVGAIDSTGTITSSIVGTGQGSYYSELNPPLDVQQYVHDLDTSTDGNNLLITSSNQVTEQILTPGDDSTKGASSDGFINGWNGSDQTITSVTKIPSYAVSALQVYLSNNIFFANDSFGLAITDGINKLLTLPNNKAPLPNSTLVNGNFISWTCPETSADGTTINASLYYFGALDQENPPGLYRLFRQSPQLASGFVYQMPMNILTSNKSSSVNSAKTAVSQLSYGKHYFSVMEVSSAATSYKLYRFLVTSSGSGTPQLGVYETQTQLFSNKVQSKQIRVYTEPTVSGNGFQIDLIGSDGSVISNGTGTYTFAAGSDPTLLQGALQRIDFNFACAPTYAMGVRITNTGTTNMTIKKIEVDLKPGGK